MMRITGAVKLRYNQYGYFNILLMHLISGGVPGYRRFLHEQPAHRGPHLHQSS